MRRMTPWIALLLALSIAVPLSAQDVQQIERMLGASPDHGGLWVAMATAHAKAGNKAEALKWLEKAEVLSCQVSGDEHFLENVSAYIRDSHYFLEKGDLIRAFEAVIWAWAWMEIGLEKGLLQQKE